MLSMVVHNNMCITKKYRSTLGIFSTTNTSALRHKKPLLVFKHLNTVKGAKHLISIQTFKHCKGRKKPKNGNLLVSQLRLFLFLFLCKYFSYQLDIPQSYNFIFYVIYGSR